MKELNALEKERLVMQRYLQTKVDAEDWHGVADAAMDLREIDAKLSLMRPWADDEQEREDETADRIAAQT